MEVVNESNPILHISDNLDDTIAFIMEKGLGYGIKNTAL